MAHYLEHQARVVVRVPAALAPANRCDRNNLDKAVLLRHVLVELRVRAGHQIALLNSAVDLCPLAPVRARAQLADPACFLRLSGKNIRQRRNRASHFILASRLRTASVKSRTNVKLKESASSTLRASVQARVAQRLPL